MSVDLHTWLNERETIHGKATDGPWYKTPNDRILSESVQWPEGDDYDVAGGLGRDGAVVEAIHDFDGNAIVDAHSALPKLLAGVRAVLELHRPIGYIDRDGETVWDECEHCTGQGWPCETIEKLQEATNDDE